MKLVMTEKKYLVRSMEEKDKPQIIGLLEHVFNGWPHFKLNCSNIEHWDWKYKNSPDLDNIIVVAEFDGMIVGCIHSQVNKMWINDKKIKSTQSMDAAILKKHRGTGLFKKLRGKMDEIRINKKIKLAYGFSTVSAVERATKEVAPIRLPYSIIQMVRINDIDYHLKENNLEGTLLKKIGYRVLKRLTTSETNEVEYNKDDFNIEKISKFDDRFDYFFNIIKNKYKFIMDRSKDYLNWRYFQLGSDEYIVEAALNGEKVLGYIIYKINRYRNYPKGVIMDLVTLPKKLDVTNMLVNNAVQYFDEQNINASYYISAKKHPHVQIMNKFGFVNNQNEQVFRFQDYGYDQIKKINLAIDGEILVQFGDSDWE